VSEELKFYHQKLNVEDYCAPTIALLPGRRCLLRRNSDPKHTDFNNNELLFFTDTISQSYPQQ